MFSFVSIFRGSKATEAKANNKDAVLIPRSLEITVGAAEGEDEFLEITTRRKTYLEVAREAFHRQSKDGTTPVLSIKTSRKNSRPRELRESRETEDELSRSANFDDLDRVNYDLKKSNRHVLKSKNKKTPAYYKELKVKKSPAGAKGSNDVMLLTS